MNRDYNREKAKLLERIKSNAEAIVYASAELKADYEIIMEATRSHRKSLD